MDNIPPLDSTFGAIFVAVVLSAVLYGVSCAQVFYYFQHYSKNDGRGTKAVVVATLVSDTIHQALISHAAYTYVITYYFQPQKLATLVWSLAIATLFSGITALIVQTFYAVRIWKFSKKNVIVTAALLIIVMGGFVSTVVYVARAIKMTTFADITRLKALSMTVNVLAAACDVLITIVFCVLLNGARNSLPSSNTMINLLIAFSVQTGILTSLCALASLISTIVSPDTFIYICFYFLMSRLYCNSLLGSLNVRRAIRGRVRGDFGMSLRPIGESHLSIADNHKEVDIKAQIMGVKTHGYITRVEVHGDDGGSPFVPSISHTKSRVVKTEPELESGRPGHPRRSSF